VTCDELTVKRRPGGPDDTGPVDRGTVVGGGGGIVDGTVEDATIVVDAGRVDVETTVVVTDGAVVGAADDELEGAVGAVVVDVACFELDESQPADATSNATTTRLRHAVTRVAPPASG
jgi:hypothetical protein